MSDKETKVEKKEVEKTAKPKWVKMRPAELEKKVLELAKEGKTPAQIGLILRDVHGVPKAKMFGKKVVQILKENEVDYQDEKKIVDAKIGTLKEHIGKNKHDYPATRSLTKQLWNVYRLKKESN